MSTRRSEQPGDWAIRQPEFGRRLRQRRTELGRSQKSIADNFVTTSYISLLESGARVPTLDVAAQLARSLDVPLQQLVGDAAVALLPPADRPGAETVPLLLAAREHLRLGDIDSAAAVLGATLDTQRRLGHQHRLLEVGLEYESVLGTLGRHPDRLALLDELLALPVTRDWDATRLALRMARVVTLREAGRLIEAKESASALLPDVPPDTRDRVQLLAILVSVLCETGDLAPVESLVEEMVGMAAAIGSRGLAARAHWAAGMAYAALVRGAEAREHLDRAREDLSYATIGLTEWLRFCRSYASVLLDVGEEADTALAWITAAEEAAGLTGLVREQAAAAVLHARHDLIAGDPEASARRLAEATAPEKGLSGLTLTGALLTRAEALRRLSRPDDAVSVLRQVVRQTESDGLYRYAVQAWRSIDEIRAAGTHDRTS